MIKNMKLNNGVEMPMEGFGVFQETDLALCEQAVSDALDCGYRLIDTASSNQNEESVGSALQRSNVPREGTLTNTKESIK